MNAADGKLSNLLLFIEDKISRGNSESWSNYDFNWLSDAIYEETGTRLSALTLKRVWGRIKYDSNPSINTVNTLARFGGFSDYRAVSQSIDMTSVSDNGLHKQVSRIEIKTDENRTETREASKASTEEPNNRNGKQKNQILSFKYALYLSLGVIGMITLVSHLTSRDSQIIDASDYRFDHEKIGSTLPASVLFKYNATAASPNDVIEIQQNWDSRRRTIVSKDDSIHSSIYYYPGFFEAKLLINDQIMMEKPLLIPSDGWVAAIDRKQVPLYINKSSSLHDDTIGISIETIRSSGINPEAEALSTVFNYVKLFEGMTTTDFSFEADIKNESLGGVNICQKSEILILLEGSVIIIPFALEGCISDLKVYLPQEVIDGKTNDLSNLGMNLSEWTQIKFVSSHGRLVIYAKDQMIASYPIDSDQQIIGVRCRFQGAGYLNNVKLYNAEHKYQLN